MDLLFRCGHSMRVDPDKVSSPVCACGERQIARALNAPAPRFRGVASGPLVTPVSLPPIAVSLKGSADGQ